MPRGSHAVCPPVGEAARTEAPQPGDSRQRPADRPDMVVRRLTPLECERLQGFPDNWTRIPWRGKPAEECADTPRYKAIGNSMAVPVMRWLGSRVQAMQELLEEE